MPIFDNNLKEVAPTVIVTDRECIQCGYNLRGLKINGQCPECGRKIDAKKRAPRYSDQLVHAPIVWLELFATGALLMFLSALGVVAMMITMFFYRGMPLVLITGFLCLAWYGGVWLTTRPRPVLATTTIDTRREWAGLRQAARVTQFFWPLACAGVIGSIAVYNATLSNWAIGASIIGTVFLAIAAIGGLAPLCILLANIADWAEDTSLAQSFRGCAWTVCFSAAVIGLSILNGFTGFLGAFIGSLLATFIIALIFMPPAYFLISLFRLQHMARWAVWNHVAAEAKMDRFKARAEFNAMRPAPPPPPPPKLDRTPRQPQTGPRR